MIAPTRRGLIGGAIAGAAAPALAGAATRPALVRAKRRDVYRARAIAVGPDPRSFVVVHEQRRTIAIGPRSKGRFVDVGGEPLEAAIAPDGRLAAITTGAWDEPGLAIVDLRRARVVKRIKVGDAPFGVAFSADGERIVVSGGEEDGEVFVIDAGRLRVAEHRSLGTAPRVVAADPGSSRVWVALNGRARVVPVDSRSGHVGRALRVPVLPDRIAVSPSGKRLLVTHGGLAAHRISEVKVKSGKVRRRKAGRLPSGVAWAGKKRRLVALAGEGRIVVIGKDGERRGRKVGGSPRSLVVAAGRAWTVDSLSGNVARVRL